MLSYVDVLLRLIGGALASPATDGTGVIVLAGIAGLTAGAVVLLAASLLTICSLLRIAPRRSASPAALAPRLSRQSDPDAAGQHRPRAPSRYLRPTAAASL